ncbi:MAG: 4-hydroxy-tetrahydrodipicolinate reductase [Pseudomonadota bacterium]
MDKIRICVAGCTGWTGSAVTKAILGSKDFALVGVVARKTAGQDVGDALGIGRVNVKISKSLDEALAEPADVLIDYTCADAVKAHVMLALQKKIRVVVGSSGLNAEDYKEINRMALANNVGVVAAGNFSITAALAKRCAVLVARYVPSWEIIDYAEPHKPDAPSGTGKELAENLKEVADNKIEMPIAQTIGQKEARGATVAGTQVHSVRLPGYKFGFDVRFGLLGERLTISHDAGTSADPYVSGTLLAAKKVMTITGLIRGMDTLL